MKKAFITFGFFMAGIGVILGLLYLFMKIYDYKSEQKRVKTHYELTDEEIAKMQDGDIILRHGYGFVSDLITETLAEESNVSHCAIFLRDDTAMNVVHSVSQSLSDYDGVQSQSLKRFISDSKMNSVMVLRYKYKPDDDKTLIGKRARFYLNKRIPFDNKFDINDSTEFFCSEFVWKVFADAYGIDVYEDKRGKDNKEFLKFDVFTNPKYFEVVFSHHNRKSKE